MIERSPMKIFSLERLKELLGRSQYRVRILVFILLFAILILTAQGIGRDKLSGQLIFEFAVTIGAVAALQILWDFLGGDPVETAIDSLSRNSVTKGEFSEVTNKIKLLYQDISLLGDIEQTGVDRLWPTRKIWQSDENDGLEIWKERIIKAENVDILSDSFWSNWFQSQDFRVAFENRIREKKGRTRLLIFRPYSPAVRQRSYDQGSSPSFLSRESNDTLDEIRGMVLRNPSNSSLNVRVNGTAMNNYQIIRADDYILIASYLMRETGSPSPTIQARKGTEKGYYYSYLKHFDHIWQESEDYWAEDNEVKVLELFVTKKGDPENILENLEHVGDIINRINVITGLHKYTIRRYFEVFTHFHILDNHHVPMSEMAFILGVSEGRIKIYKQFSERHKEDRQEKLDLMAKISFSEWGG